MLYKETGHKIMNQGKHPMHPVTPFSVNYGKIRKSRLRYEIKYRPNLCKITEKIKKKLPVPRWLYGLNDSRLKGTFLGL